MALSIARLFCSDGRVHVFRESSNTRTRVVRRETVPTCGAAVRVEGEVTLADGVFCSSCERAASLLMPTFEPKLHEKVETAP